MCVCVLLVTLGPHAPSVVTQIATGCWVRLCFEIMSAFTIKLMFFSDICQNLDPKDRPTADDAHRTLSSAADALGVSQSQVNHFRKKTEKKPTI